MPPLDELEEDKRRAEAVLKLEKARTDTLYQQYRQQYLKTLMPKVPAPIGKREAFRETTDVRNKIREAYAEAYADGMSIRAFQDALGAKEQQPQQVQAAQEEKPQLRSMFLQSWLNLAGKDPEKARELLDKLGEEQLAKLAYMDTANAAKEGVNPLLLALLGNPKSNVSDIVSVVNMLPKAPTFQEQMAATMTLADKFTEKNPPQDPQDQMQNPMMVMMKEQVDAIRAQAQELEKANDLLAEQLHKKEIAEKEKEIESYRQAIGRLEDKMSKSGSGSPDLMFQIEKLKQESNIKLEEMKQAHDRWLSEQSMESKKWDQIGQIIQGPVGKFVENIGGAASDKIRGGPGKPNIPVKVERITCSSCGKPFYANTLADYAVCAACGMVLKKSAEATQQKTEVTQQTEVAQKSAKPEEGSAPQ
jgi:hypothetical protein